MLVVVDDHSRFKQVYFLRSKSDAMSRVKQFVRSLNAYASRGKSEPVRIVGTLRTDNAAGNFFPASFATSSTTKVSITLPAPLTFIN